MTGFTLSPIPVIFSPCCLIEIGDKQVLDVLLLKNEKRPENTPRTRELLPILIHISLVVSTVAFIHILSLSLKHPWTSPTLLWFPENACVGRGMISGTCKSDWCEKTSKEIVLHRELLSGHSVYGVNAENVLRRMKRVERTTSKKEVRHEVCVK